MTVQHVPHVPLGFHSVTPYLIVRDAERLIEFLGQTFDARVRSRFDNSDGLIVNAEVVVVGSIVEVSEASPEWPALPAAVHVFVPDVDQVYRKALAAGAASLGEPADRFFGVRSAEVRDPTGTTWFLSTQVEALTEEELARRAHRAGLRSAPGAGA